MYGTRILSIGAATALLLVSPGARAGTFDAQGYYSFDPAAVVAEGFEQASNQTDMEVVTGDALEGSRFVRVTTGDMWTSQKPPWTVPLSLPEEKKAWRVRAFFRGADPIYASVAATYSGNDGPRLARAHLYPTGDLTSDGWMEYSSAPLSIDGSRAPKVKFTLSSERVELDALEVVEAPGAWRAPKPCVGADQSACSGTEVCIAGWCRDGDAMVPPLPPAGERDAWPDWIAGRVQNMFGGVASRRDNLPAALELLAEMKSATTAWQFWNAFAVGIRRLHDSHTVAWTGMTHSYLWGNRAFPICLAEGDADLSHAAAPSDPVLPDILVTHVAPQSGILKPGDRVVAIDGMHPIVFGESVERWLNFISPSSDPAAHGGIVQWLPQAIMGWGTTLTVVRCDAATKTCGQPDQLEVSSLPQDDGSFSYPYCDMRPAYHLGAKNPDPESHMVNDPHWGLVEGSNDEEAIYGMVWNGMTLPTDFYPAYDDFRAKAKGLILDHRMGWGGYAHTASYLTSIFRQKTVAARWLQNRTTEWLDQPFTQADGKAVFESLSGGIEFPVGSDEPLDIPIAVLLAFDASASDQFAFGARGSPSARLFGSATSGAFSTFAQFQFANWLTWSLATGDFFEPDGTAHLGHGVQPDEPLLPRQSDLVVGKDTAWERALEWVRTGVTP